MKKILMLITILIATIFMLSGCDYINTKDIEAVTHTVVYSLEEENTYFTQDVIEGQNATMPTTPNKEEFFFAYWTLNSEEYSFDEPITKDIVLIAKWAEEIEIKLYDNETLIKILLVAKNSSTSSLIDYVIPGPDEPFIGWFLEDSLNISLDSIDSITEDITIYGKWEKSVTIDMGITEEGLYTSKDEVALYIATFHKLPCNYMTKSEAGGSNGSDIKYLWTATNKSSIGGDVFGNREGLLPAEIGRTFTELDIDYDGSSRGAKRIVYSSDFRIFYTEDHYDSFVEYDKESGEWKSY